MQSSRRKSRRTIFDLATEAAVWSAWFLITAAIILAACIALTLAAPS